VGSVHRATWPEAGPLRDEARAAGADITVYPVAAEVLGAIRKAKSDAKVSMRAEVAEVRVGDTAARLGALLAARGDVLGAGRAATLVTREAPEASVEVDLAPVADG
jgi:valyl-tRNA synthetase